MRVAPAYRSFFFSLILTGLVLCPIRTYAQPARSADVQQTPPHELKRPLDQTDPAALARLFATTDRAVGQLDLSDLVVYTYNFGNTISGRIYSSGRAYYPNSEGVSRGFIFESSPAFAVPAGPWHSSPIVHENSDNHSTTKLDWEALDGSRGLLFTDVPGFYHYPLMAHSDLPSTWPQSGWPAPEAGEAPWFGGTTWKLWERRAHREVYAVFTDAYADREQDGQSRPLGIEVRVRGLCYEHRNIVFFQYEFTNTSPWYFTDVYLGQIVDSGNPTVNDWQPTEPFLHHDPERQLVYAVGCDYDPVAGTHRRAPGGESVGWVGTMWLQTPTGSFKEDENGDCPETPDRILTRLALLDWSTRVLGDEAALYGALSGDISLMDPTAAEDVWKVSQNAGQPVLLQTEDHFTAWHQTANIPDRDLFYYAASGPLTMAPGESLEYVIALVAGATETALLQTADRARTLFNSRLVPAGPPPPPASLRADGPQAGPHGRQFDPRLHAYPLSYSPSGEITLVWDGLNSETTPDPETGELDLEGYRVFRSLDRGRTWGEPITDTQGNRVGWTPWVQFDRDDGVTGPDPLGFTWLGDDTGLQHRWSDTNVLDGVEYWYAITAYDRGLIEYERPVLRSLSSPLGQSPADPNVIAVIPGSRPGGYEPGKLIGSEATSDRQVLTLQDGQGWRPTIEVLTVDESALTGLTYTVTVTATSTDSAGIYPWWGGLTVTSEAGLICRNRRVAELNGGEPASPFLFDGLFLTVREPNGGNGGIAYIELSTDPGQDNRQHLSSTGAVFEAAGPACNRANLTGFSNDLELRFTGFLPAGADSNVAHDMATRRRVPVPFELWDIETETRLYAVIEDLAAAGQSENNQGEWDGRDPIFATTVPYFATGGSVTDFAALHPPDDDTYWEPEPSDPASRSDWVYRLQFYHSDPAQNRWNTGDIWFIRAVETLQSQAGTEYDFATAAPAVASAAADLETIRVVPNPWCAGTAWEAVTGERKIQFRNVPADCTISIYTISGELVAILDHHGSAADLPGSGSYLSDRIGIVDWNLRSYELREVAYGLYLFVVKTDDGRQRVGKFAIIR